MLQITKIPGPSIVRVYGTLANRSVSRFIIFLKAALRFRLPTNQNTGFEILGILPFFPMGKNGTRHNFLMGKNGVGPPPPQYINILRIILLQLWVSVHIKSLTEYADNIEIWNIGTFCRYYITRLYVDGWLAFLKARQHVWSSQTDIWSGSPG